MKLWQLIGLNNVDTLMVDDRNTYILRQDEQTGDYITEPKDLNDLVNQDYKDIVAIGSFYTCSEFAKQLTERK